MCALNSFAFVHVYLLFVYSASPHKRSRLGSKRIFDPLTMVLHHIYALNFGTREIAKADCRGLLGRQLGDAAEEVLVALPSQQDHNTSRNSQQGQYDVAGGNSDTDHRQQTRRNEPDA